MPSSSPPASPRTALSARRVVRIVVADDHAAVRRGLVQLLHAEEDLRVVAEAADLGGACRAVREHLPDVLLLDLNMPGGSSLSAIPAILQRAPTTAVVILTMQDDPAYERRARSAGAAGYVLKDAADVELVSVLRAAAPGRATTEE